MNTQNKSSAKGMMQMVGSGLVVGGGLATATGVGAPAGAPMMAIGSILMLVSSFMKDSTNELKKIGESRTAFVIEAVPGNKSEYASAINSSPILEQGPLNSGIRVSGVTA